MFIIVFNVELQPGPAEQTSHYHIKSQFANTEVIGRRKHRSQGRNLIAEPSFVGDAFAEKDIIWMAFRIVR